MCLLGKQWSFRYAFQCHFTQLMETSVYEGYKLTTCVSYFISGICQG